MRILESGLPVYGFGEKKTPSAFVQACSQFIYTEKLKSGPEEQTTNSVAGAKRSRKQLRGDMKLVKLLRKSVEQTSDDDGWAHLGKVGQYISNNSSFSPVNYGYRKLSDLVRASELFAVEKKNGDTAMYIKYVG
jgi:uncharacterized LabA/DUF88 family protein